MAKTKEQIFNWNRNWNKSKKGVCIRLWHHNKTNSIKRGHPEPSYTQEELTKWILSQPNFDRLYSIWVESGYDRMKAVSIDRLNNSKGYSFDNIQLVDFQTNCDNAIRDTKHKLIHNPTLLNGGHRAVTQFDLKGNPICSHISLSAAAEYLGADSHQSISACCLGKKLYWKKYLWCYSDKYNETLQNIKELSDKAIKEYKLKNSAILQYSLNGIYLNSFTTITEAAKYNNLTTNLVSKWMQGKSTTIKPTYIFKRKEPEI